MHSFACPCCLCYPAGRMQEKTYYVYMMTNRSKTLYIGITSNIKQRVWRHKNHVFPGFTDRYCLDRLVWFERYTVVQTAIAREKQLKGWRRTKKIALIVAMHPTWRDLSEEWGKPIEIGAVPS